MITLKTIEEISENIKKNELFVLVFSTHSCSVCKPLKQKIEQVLLNYEKVAYGEVFIDDLEAAKGLFQVYTSPITLVFVQGRESKRYSAAIDMKEFQGGIDRIISLMSDEETIEETRQDTTSDSLKDQSEDKKEDLDWDDFDYLGDYPFPHFG